MTAPWKKGFRWRIPRLPSAASIEFSFRAVDPASNDYEVVLYNTDRVVIEMSKGELPAGERRSGAYHKSLTVGMTASVAIFAMLTMFLSLLGWPQRDSKVTTFSEAGCTFTVVSSYAQFGLERGWWPWSGGPWKISNRVLNIGSPKCTMQSEKVTSTPMILSPGQDVKGNSYAVARPKLVSHNIPFGTDSLTQTIKVPFYDEPR